MPEYHFQITALVQALENDLFLAEALGYPEFSCLGEDADLLVSAIETNARRVLEKLASNDLGRRRLAAAGNVEPITVELEPPRSLAWRQPVELTFPVVHWQHGETIFRAYVPALEIEIIADSAKLLAELVPRHIRMAILRTKRNSLERLALIARAPTMQARNVSITLERPTLRQAAQAERERHQRKESILRTVATDLVSQDLRPAFTLDEPLALVAETLLAHSPKCVLLVGPSGVGKTALVHELVRQRNVLGLAGRPFWATSGALLVAGQSGFGMWQERCHQMLREASRTQAILHIGNLLELLEVGKSEYQSQGLATFLRPWLARGDLLAIAECTPEQLPLLEREDPHLVRAFVQVPLAEPDDVRLALILERCALRGATPRLLPDGLAELLRLHRRYATYSANPGRPLRFLRNLLADQPADMPIIRTAVTSAFARETGLPLVLFEDDVRLDLAEAQSWFGARVIGQGEAVDLVVDLLATVKAAMNRPRKPLASLFFIGPTGVGKTEMAKALAEFLFSSRDRLTRFDMSEYADPLAVQRLIGGVIGSEGLLTARVREQPFSVVLLDEVEKAHPQLLDLLLQVLGEGRLTDAGGRLADFHNSVIIMTSNLGAESYLQGNLGLVAVTPTAQRARDHFLHAVREAVRPELFNRIDRIVPFAPLSEEVIRQVAARQLDLLTRRDGVRYRGVSLDLDPGLTAWLGRRGYDARYGARPLKRALEQAILAPLAARMNQYANDTPLRMQIRLVADEPVITVRARTDRAGGVLNAGGLGSDDVNLAEAVLVQRRTWQKLQASSAMRQVHNEIYRLDKLHKRHHYHDPAIAQLERLRDEADAGLAMIVMLEEEALVALYGQLPLDANTQARLEDGQRQLNAMILQLYLRQFDAPDCVSLALFSEQPEALFALTAAYRHTMRLSGGGVEAWQFTPGKGKEATGPERRRVLDVDHLFGPERDIEVNIYDPKRELLLDTVRVSSRKGVVGLGLVLRGPGVLPRYLHEAGLHTVHGTQTSKVLVVAGAERMAVLPLPENIDRRGTIGPQPRRRGYHLEANTIEDGWTGTQTQAGLDLAGWLGRCMEETLQIIAREVIA